MLFRGQNILGYRPYAQKLGAKIFLPELKYCGDNGAMIAAQGYYEFQDGNLADWSLNGLPTLPIDYR